MGSSSIILVFILVFGLIILANIVAARNDELLNRRFDLLLLLFNVPIVLLGLLYVVVPPELFARLQAEGSPLLSNLNRTGAVFVLMGVWGIVMSRPPVRTFMARWLPIDAYSPVHALALILCGYLVGNTLLTLGIGGLEELVDTAVSATIPDVILQQALFAFLGLLGVGLFVRRNGRTLLVRLGLERPTFSQIRMGLRWIILLVLLQAAVGAIWAVSNPDQSAVLEGVNEALLSDFDTVGEWFVLALSAGIGEELLFRGALQPALGIGFTSLIFAVAHVQYGFTPVTLAVFIIGIALGYIRNRSNTTVAIFVHFGYNFVLGLLSLLAIYAT